jgi:2-oxoglutarate ferredoxin oxidoreductase subunit delta
MAKVRGAIEVDIEKCKGCGVCVTACPTQVIQLAKQVNGKGYNYAHMDKPEACIGCANCALVCPDSVITVYKVKV